MTTTFLQTILTAKKRELEQRKRETPLAVLEERISALPSPMNFSGALWGDSIRLIAEVKKASPSRGLLVSDFHPGRLASIYAQNGASAISVLTETAHFQGSLDHLEIVKREVQNRGVPVLRKDFLFDPYHLYETRAHGADAALLIVAMLSPAQIDQMLRVAHSLWLQCLVEVHSEEELEIAIQAGAEIVGINHRDLRTFQVDTSLTQRLHKYIPREKVIVAESGIRSREDVLTLHRLGVNAILVGEALVTAPDPGGKTRELLGG